MMENSGVNSCTDCGLVFDSSKSLDVHLSYHKEALLSKWGSSGTSASEDNNNQVKKPRPAAADSSDFLLEYQEASVFQRLPRTQYRYHPYSYERPTSTQVQCDKCGVSLSADQLADHLVHMHPIWEEPQAEILDLDSHKVHVYQPPEEQHQLQQQQQQQQQHHQQAHHQQMHHHMQQQHQLQQQPPQQQQHHPWKYFKEENGNSPSPSDLGAVSSSEVYLGEAQGGAMALPKAAWKSNEARRPKTYNCTACNKWFTSSGHLKRHYNTTLHKNAVKQSGGVDPATMPVSSHHHPVEEYHPPPPPPPPVQQQQQQQVQHQQQLHHAVQLPQHQPPPQLQDFYYGYPNGNPPHGTANLPSFSQLTGVTGVNYEPVGGTYQDKEVLVVSSTAEDEPQLKPPPQVHKCVDCDKTFNKACYLTQHNKTFHSGDKPFKCVRCGKRFPQEYLHLEHLSKHAGEKPYKCEVCPKQFNHKTDLRRHMCLHSGDKPYACAYCSKGFIRKDHMLKHAETHKKKLNYKNEYRI